MNFLIEIFDFKEYKNVTPENNMKIFSTLSKRLSNLMNDINNANNEQLFLSIFSTFRVLFRSKAGLKPLMTKEVWIRMCETTRDK